MDNGFAAVLEAVSNGDDGYQKQFVNDSVSLITMTLALMNLQTEWQNKLTEDKYNYLAVSVSSDPATAMQAKALQVVYDTDTSIKDVQCNGVQTIVQGVQSQVNSDNTDRQQNYSVAGSISGYFGFAMGVLKQ